MRPIAHFEVPHLALWKSAVSRVLATELKESRTTAAAIDADHPLMAATDRYCLAMANNEPIPEPPSDRPDDPAVDTYLAWLHHRRAHARIGGDRTVEAEIERQTRAFTFGNRLWQKMFVQYCRYYWQYPFHKGRAPLYRSWRDRGPAAIRPSGSSGGGCPPIREW